MTAVDAQRPVSIAVIDPSGRLLAEAAPLVALAAPTFPIRFVAAKPGASVAEHAAVLVSAALAGDLGAPLPSAPPRWIVGDGSNAARLAGAAAQASAAGVLFTPLSVAALAAIVHTPEITPELDLVRARGLIASSLIDLTGHATDTLLAVAGGFSASDCILWWLDGGHMVPTAARRAPDDAYRTEIAGAARVAAATAGTVITSGPAPRAVIADALRSSTTEVGGLIAIVADTPRRYSTAERTDLKALAMRLTRELSWLASHRRFVADGERLLAASLHDPLTGAISRGAFEQTIAHEAAVAARRNEPLSLAVLDVVGLRRINLQHGHKAGDEVLAQIASRVRQTVRGNDPIGRLGGDEIAVLMVNASAEQGAEVIHTLLGRIQGAPIAVDAATELRVQMRATVTELAAGERSGEAAMSRCYGALRAAPIGDLRVVASDERLEPAAGSDAGGLTTGTIVGGTYRVVHELSRGAMGVVYRGEDLGLGRPVAIKVLRSDLASDRDLVARFRAEAGLLASLHHPNLVQVYALGEHDGAVYFVMELVEGQPLSEVLRATLDRSEWFPTAAIAQIALEIGDALDAMHAVGVIHRDVKPANILLDRERDRAVLVDVGVAVKAGDQRDAAGTPGFAAPESFLDHTDAPTTDVYGLAATVYCMLTGRPPFGAGPAPQVVQRQLGEPLLPPSQLRPSLTEAVDAVIAKALSPTAKKRWASASTFSIALARALDRVPATDASLVQELEDPVKAAEVLLGPTEGLSQIASIELPAPAVTRVITGHVRAAHLRVLSRLLQHHVGDAGLAQIVSDTPSLAGALSVTLAPLGWVELGALVTALGLARTHVPSQLVPRKVGRGTMSATFARLFGAEPTGLLAEDVVAALPAFWPRYHDWGDVDVHVAPGSADVVVHGFAGAADVCTLVAAELERVVELTGAAAVGVVHTACALTGARRCEYRVTWTQPSPARATRS
ncbi:MAG TPA: diguanylate cyclase [Kofleriaceae bacterium]|nr:diguanylate cyclase [Kofleriaceae bacterium]